LDDAQKSDRSVISGSVFLEKLPSVDFGRVSAYAARQTIVQKIKEAERAKQYEEFKDRVGDVVTGTVKRVDLLDVVVEIGRSEGVLRKHDLLPNEIFRSGDRVKVLLVAVNRDLVGPLLTLSRTHNDFLKKLFEQEVPEVYDGAVKIVSVARDPGSKSKVAVSSSDPTLDPIGACVGVKGSRVQAVVDELKGEKVDIVLWSDNPGMFIANSLSSVDVLRVVLDEEKRAAEVVVPDSMLSLTIGRRGQNVRLSSRLTRWDISVVTSSDDSERRSKANERLLSLFMSRLDVDELISRLLISEQFLSLEDISAADVDRLSCIKGFNIDLASEIKRRAIAAIAQDEVRLRQLFQDGEISNELLEFVKLKASALLLLIEGGMKSLDDIGDLSTDEFLEITKNSVPEQEAEGLIMSIRRRWPGGSAPIVSSSGKVASSCAPSGEEVSKEAVPSDTMQKDITERHR
jgi:N utilization substance protein A